VAYRYEKRADGCDAPVFIMSGADGYALSSIDFAQIGCQASIFPGLESRATLHTLFIFLSRREMC